VTSYDAGTVRASTTLRPSERRRRSVGSIGGGPKSATLATRSAADTYFSIRTGDSESTSAMLSKPCPASSCGKSSADDVHAEQLCDRVLPRCGSAPGGHPARIGAAWPRRCARAREEPRGHRLALLAEGCSLRGRHLAATESADDLVPLVAMFDERRARLERLEVEIVFLLLVAVAVEAVLREKRFDECIEAGWRVNGPRRPRRCLR
jgi:hypothetical protein